MEITNICLDNTTDVLFQKYMKDTPESVPAELRYVIESVDENSSFEYKEGESLVYSVVLDGTIQYSVGGRSLCEAKTGESLYCELEERMKGSGNGHLISMIMENGIRGSVRIQSVTKERVMKIGETIGESCILLFGLDGDLKVEYGEDIYECPKGNGLILYTEKKEFAKIRVVCERQVQMVMMNGVKMFDHDFSRVIGVRILEQGYGTCKVGLEVTEDHMNPIGSVHGGCLFTMADEAAGVSASSTGGICTTVDSHIEFLNAALNPKYLTAEAKPKKIGKKIRSFNVEIRDEKDTLICSGDFIFYCLQN